MVGRQFFEVIIDTVFDKLVLEKEGCKNCKGTKFYDPSKSENSEKISSSPINLSYGSASIVAEEYEDEACLNWMCADNYKFYPFTKETGLIEDGLIGFSPATSTLFYTISEQRHYLKGVFMIATYRQPKQSYIDLGGLYEGFFLDIKNITYTPTVRDDYWTVGLGEATFGTLSFYNEWTDQAIVDTGTSALVMEDSDYNDFLELFLDANPQFENYESSGTYLSFGPCPIADSIFLFIKGVGRLEIPSDQYLEEKTYKSGSKRCEVKVESSGFEGPYILGEVFTRT